MVYSLHLCQHVRVLLLSIFSFLSIPHTHSLRSSPSLPSYPSTHPSIHPYQTKTSVVVRKVLLKERKQAKRVDSIKEEEFKGKVERIPFGEVVDRPPSFDDLKLPGDSALDKPKKLSNTDKLAKALQEADPTVRAKYQGLLGNKGDVASRGKLLDDQGYLRQHLDKTLDTSKGSAPITKADRERLLREAREKKRQAELEKTRQSAMAAYADLKQKRAGESKRKKAGMSSLTFSTMQIKEGAMQAAKDLADFERQNTTY